MARLVRGIDAAGALKCLFHRYFCCGDPQRSRFRMGSGVEWRSCRRIEIKLFTVILKS
jgi:hypothetical protein